jgi:hypothetical protein
VPYPNKEYIPMWARRQLTKDLTKASMMKQLRFTTTKPFSMFEFGEEHAPLVIPEHISDFITDKVKGKTAYIHDDAEALARFDIPVFIDGNLGQLELPKEEQDILMLLPSGEYPCVSEYVDKSGSSNCYFITLK